MILNKKAFTLIELLAVIVVLSIILAIAVPRVINVIVSARSESLGNFAQIVTKYLKQKYQVDVVNGTAATTSTTGFANDCPSDAGFNQTKEGDCQYDITITGTEAVFTVKIIGSGKFDGYIATSINVNTSTVSSSKMSYVQDFVEIGDYINYDAGNWSSTVAIPTVHGTYGGYTSGNSKNHGIDCANAGLAVSGRNGWRVFDINSATGEVSLIHVGTPECYYHSTDAANSITNLTTGDFSYYVNSTYDTSAVLLTKEMAEALIGNPISFGYDLPDPSLTVSAALLRSGTRYYFPYIYNSTYLFYAQPGGYVGAYRYIA